MKVGIVTEVNKCRDAFQILLVCFMTQAGPTQDSHCCLWAAPVLSCQGFGSLILIESKHSNSSEV